MIGSAAVFLSGHVDKKVAGIYVMGGYDSMSHGDLVRLQLPDDLCTLHTDAGTCLNATGCAFCTVHDTNQTFCYANDGPRPAGCLVENTTVSIKQGVACDLLRVEERECGQHKQCRECLTMWPQHRGHKQVNVEIMETNTFTLPHLTLHFFFFFKFLFNLIEFYATNVPSLNF